MTSEIRENTGEFAPLGPHGPIFTALGRRAEHPIVRVVALVFAFASLCHLWLLDAAHPDWYPANAIYLAGLLALCWPRHIGNAAGWLLSAVGVGIPLFFHRDPLTQSMILLFFSTSAGGSLLISNLLHLRKRDAQAGASWLILRVFQGITVCTYLLAALHKLNREFFAPDYSCAVYGVDKLFNYWHLNLALLPAGWRGLAPWSVLVGELGIALLYLVGKRRWAWAWAVVFHIPLTLTMAPAFAFVMFAGHAAFLRPADLAHLRRTLQRNLLPTLIGATALTAASLWMHRALPEWTMIPREWLLWAMLITLVGALLSPSAQTDSEVAPCEKPSRWLRALTACIVGLFLLNGLTPYLGVQYQHAGAMVSGLRVDKGCWNSLVFPESVRLRDDYIRVDAVYFHTPGHLPEYEKKVRTTLWSPPQLRQMRRNWCREDLRPLYLSGTFHARRFEIDDLCADTPLPFGDAGAFGVELFGGYLRFQKNLKRACPQTCIH
ncbi:hypothetical protein [Bradymonas sediminis]|uniref:Uncharacterized protein n=1 Tax=Bradymonas sediminis TaxID=1548548 RepID=A0A2Z4FNK8_9DELT|nr:hypothetical protein [Bradymonas sediminis]AWV90365.1 hypothetical protein DN745_13915 [Bradymonas sediminis]TDP72252.1 hypothetical protein DFR33_107236 [Bradymonas sediminis]